MEVAHDLFKFTTTDENGGLGRSVGADRGTAVPRAATSSDQEVAAQERCSHIKTRIFLGAGTPLGRAV